MSSLSALFIWLTHTVTPCMAGHLRWRNLGSTAATDSAEDTRHTSSTQAGSITGRSILTATSYLADITLAVTRWVTPSWNAEL